MIEANLCNSSDERLWTPLRRIEPFPDQFSFCRAGYWLSENISRVQKTTQADFNNGHVQLPLGEEAKCSSSENFEFRSINVMLRIECLDSAFLFEKVSLGHHVHGMMTGAAIAESYAIPAIDEMRTGEAAVCDRWLLEFLPILRAIVCIEEGRCEVAYGAFAIGSRDVNGFPWK